MTEEQENKLIIAFLQDVIAQMNGKEKDSQTDWATEWWNKIPHGPSMGD